MFIVMIIVIAVVILVYFSFFTGKQDGSGEIGSVISDVKAEASSVEATVKDKYVTEDGRKRKHYMVYMVVFDCGDGEEREFRIERELFEGIKVGERDTLIYSDSIFLGFGEHGATEITDNVEAGSDSGDFSYDDFDESIDVEQSVSLSGEGPDPLSDEDAEYFEQFRGRVKLPSKSETIEDETDSLTEYLVRDLLQKTTLYPFLKREDDVSGMFERTYREAVSDMLGFAGNSRKGTAADSVFINKNEIRVSILIQECPPTLKSKITAEFGVNE